jgi:hypothetical protein
MTGDQIEPSDSTSQDIFKGEHEVDGKNWVGYKSQIKIKKQATRKRLGMHVLLTEVEERNSKGKTPSILVKERESRGRNSRPSKKWTKICPSSSERGGICMESRGCNKSE